MTMMMKYTDRKKRKKGRKEGSQKECEFRCLSLNFLLRKKMNPYLFLFII